MQNILKDLYAKTKFNRFPIAQPVHYTGTKNLKIKLSDYLLSNKFDGERMILMYHQDILYAINQRLELKKLEKEISFPKEYVLDIEYSEYSNKYYVLDIISLYNLPFESRLKKINDLVYTPNQSTNLHCKLFVDLKFPEKALELLQHEDETLDGYIFSRKDAFVKFGRNPNFLKWKTFSELTVDFVYFNEYLCVLNSDGYKPIFKHNSEFPCLNQNDVVECFPTLENSKVTWHFKKFRLDKDKPNFITTYQSILNEILLPGRKAETINSILNSK